MVHGKKHDIYENSRTGRRVVVPRQGLRPDSRELANGIYRSMLRDAKLD
jgi:predicted RNA binding protein YcfA (HicA-like mRNA interferase family)